MPARSASSSSAKAAFPSRRSPRSGTNSQQNPSQRTTSESSITPEAQSRKRALSSTSSQQAPSPKKAKTSSSSPSSPSKAKRGKKPSKGKTASGPRPIRESICQNCGCGNARAQLWRTNPDPVPVHDNVLCNACALYRHQHGIPRPPKFWHRGDRSNNTYSEDGVSSTAREAANLPRCHNKKRATTTDDDEAHASISGSDEASGEEETEAARILLAMSGEVGTPDRRARRAPSARHRFSDEWLEEKLFQLRPSHYFNPPPPAFPRILVPPGCGLRVIEPVLQLPTPVPSPPNPAPRRHPSAPIIETCHKAIPFASSSRNHACCPSTIAGPTSITPPASIRRVSDLLASPQPIKRTRQI
ncbi:hypothetical protein IAR55_006120 [Kwoniella newhampshirensis]|uniref:GATA-type domain-containing protein n=1 Tax=Kwoniella newhampshirensis TaxID=1651941 RepID=A0AAW0YU01_9TREE